MKSVSHAACLPWSAGTVITLQCFHIELEKGLSLLMQSLARSFSADQRVTIPLGLLGVFFPGSFLLTPKLSYSLYPQRVTQKVLFLSAGIMAALAALE